jgi:hypothetical protein
MPGNVIGHELRDEIIVARKRVFMAKEIYFSPGAMSAAKCDECIK